MAGQKNGDRDISKMTVEELQAEDLRLQVEERRWRIEEMRLAQEDRTRKREDIIQAHKNQQKAIDDYNRDVLSQQAICRHKKGGKNLPGVLNGSAAEYSVVVHTFPWGEVMVICTRCAKEWRRPNPKLAKKDPRAYAKQSREYEEALRFPTDNEPSGSQLFTFTQTPPTEVLEAMG